MKRIFISAIISLIVFIFVVVLLTFTLSLQFDNARFYALFIAVLFSAVCFVLVYKAKKEYLKSILIGLFVPIAGVFVVGLIEFIIMRIIDVIYTVDGIYYHSETRAHVISLITRGLAFVVYIGAPVLAAYVFYKQYKMKGLIISAIYLPIMYVSLPMIFLFIGCAFFGRCI